MGLPALTSGPTIQSALVRGGQAHQIRSRPVSVLLSLHTRAVEHDRWPSWLLIRCSLPGSDRLGPGLLCPPPPHLHSALPPPDCPLLCDESQEWGGVNVSEHLWWQHRVGTWQSSLASDLGARLEIRWPWSWWRMPWYLTPIGHPLLAS